MIITWYGHSCFKIQTKPKRGKEEVVIFTDPFEKSIGLKPPQGQADIVTISHDHFDHNNAGAFKKSRPFLVDAPGEYSIQDIVIEGIESFHDKNEGEERGRNTIFTIKSEDIKICHLGDLGHKLNEEQVEKIGQADVLMVPVGGVYTIDAKEAEEVIGQIDPKIIIPMHFKVPGLKVDINGDEKFSKEFGVKIEEEVPKLVLKKKDIQDTENKIVVMSLNK
ncbi:MAG: MBL fold metallo-hydrolase [Candidatus Moranbacteria bacterium]|nr:MBL fold metallo-hydrolase [Candidatus Moranbacteria bacterium]